MGMSIPAPIKPVLELRDGSHDRHVVLWRIYQRVHAAEGGGTARLIVMHHAAEVLMACPCDEGRQLRGAVREWAGQSRMGRQPIRIAPLSGSPHVEGKAHVYARVADRAKIARDRKRTLAKDQRYYRSTRRIVVAPEYVLYLAGWPCEVTGVEYAPLGK